MPTLKEEALNGVKWTSISTAIKSILQLIQLIILARFLTSEDFGLVAIVMVIIGFSQLFMDMGISNAIIHKQKISYIQLSSLYWLNILSGLTLTILIYLSAEYIAIFYENEKLIPLIQVLSITFFINSLSNQYKILLTKELNFNLIAKIEIVAVILSFISAILLAVNNFGAYSLIYATLIMTSISSILFFTIGIKNFKPKFVFKPKEIKSFFSFGLYQMGQNSIVYFNNQFDVILIGKLLGTEALGIYSLTKQLVMRPSQIINPIITRVTFPIMAKTQNDIFRLKSIYLKIINYLSSVNFPIYILMIVLANEIIPLILGPKWIDAILIFQILSVYALIKSTMNPAGSLLLSKGRADIGFWWSSCEFILMPLVIFIGSSYNIMGVAISLLIFQVIMILPNWYFIVNKMCNAKFKEYFYVQVQPLISILISISIIYYIVDTNNSILKLVLFTSLTMIIYLIISKYINKNFINEMMYYITKKGKK